jgi:hypothetical protein
MIERPKAGKGAGTQRGDVRLDTASFRNPVKELTDGNAVGTASIITRSPGGGSRTSILRQDLFERINDTISGIRAYDWKEALIGLGETLLGAFNRCTKANFIPPANHPVDPGDSRAVALVVRGGTIVQVPLSKLPD